MKKSKTRNAILTRKLTESSLMVAFATVLGMLKLVEMPYGGSVTMASMLPIVIISYRSGIAMGLGSGLVFAVIQQLLGLNNLSYVTGWQSVLAVIFLDYVFAFTVVGFGGVFKGKINVFATDFSKRQSVELGTGMALVCFLRYLCHTIAGATVWAGLSIPTEAALIYSIGYNATYMIPETLVSVIVSLWLGSVIDFSKNLPTRFLQTVQKDLKGAQCEIFKHFATILSVFAVAFDTILIAPHLQDQETGTLTFSNLGNVNWILAGVVSAVLFAASIVLIAVAKKKEKSES